MNEQSTSASTAPGLPAGLLERLLGKPPAAWTADDLIALVRERGIRTIALMHVGGDGWLKTLDFVPLSTNHVHDILAGGERADGSSLFAETGIRPEASDVILRPRLASAFLDPFAPHPTLALLCEHFGRDGRPLAESPDTILRRAAARVEETAGVTLWALGEVEYFLGKRAEDGDVYGAHDRGYHATAPFVFGEALRRRAMAVLGDIGVPVKYGHSEVGYIEAREMNGLIWEQHEIELALAPLAAAAEAVVLTQWVLRRLAHAADMRLSLEPVLLEGHAGSGLHFHFAPYRGAENLAGAESDDALRDEARWLIGGLVQMGGALMAFGNRSAGSFVRLAQGKETPATVAWGRYNRHALVRLPAVARTAEGRAVTPPTIEFRLPDGSAHPYLLLAGVAQALVAGREMPDLPALLARTHAEAAKPLPVTGGSPIPRRLGEVADALTAHRAALEQGEVFPAGLLAKTIAELRSRSPRSAVAAAI